MTMPLLEDNILLYAGAAAVALVVLILLISLLTRKRPAKKTAASEPVRPAPSEAARAPVATPAPIAPAPVASPPVAAPTVMAPPIAPEPVATPAPPPIVEAPPAPAEMSKSQISLPFSSASDWPVYDRRFREGALIDGRYRLSAGEGVRSVAHLPATPGATYRVDFTAASLRDSSNGAPNNFVLGPLFLDSAGAILNRWVGQRAFTIADGEKAGAVEAVAPPNAATVHVGMGGQWARESAPGDGIVAIANVTLSQV
jgi:hypothetical protein